VAAARGERRGNSGGINIAAHIGSAAARARQRRQLWHQPRFQRRITRIALIARRAQRSA
jgi:hypothetical protein